MNSEDTTPEVPEGWDELRPLRPRNKLEEQLAAQVALGTIKSLEDAKQRGTEDSLEYCAQVLFDQERLEIAVRERLPVCIIAHLARDRNTNVRCETLGRHWGRVPSEIQQEFLLEGITTVRELRNDKSSFSQHPYYDAHCENGADKMEVARVFAQVMQRAFEAGDDDFTVEMLEKVNHPKGVACVWIEEGSEILRRMPKTVTYIYSPAGHIRFIDLVAPEEESRRRAVKQTLKMKVGVLRNTFATFRWKEEKGTHIKTMVYNFIATDPSVKIRRLLVDETSHLPTLQHIAETDTDVFVKRNAIAKAAQLQKRAAYAKQYHSTKKGR